MSTIRDVAKHANVSVATVSKYLNGGHVREQKEQAIQAAMQELEYQINPYAKSLRTRRSMAVGILLPSALTPFFSSSRWTHPCAGPAIRRSSASTVPITGSNAKSSSFFPAPGSTRWPIRRRISPPVNFRIFSAPVPCPSS